MQRFIDIKAFVTPVQNPAMIVPHLTASVRANTRIWAAEIYSNLLT